MRAGALLCDHGTVMRIRIGLLILAIGLAGCGAKQESKRYAMQGEIRSLDPISKSATIKASKVGDWMEAMTMEYPVKPESEFQKLHVGDQIHATVVVSDLKYFVTDVNVTPK
jgi:Cu/Ag efflux protein CusF